MRHVFLLLFIIQGVVLSAATPADQPVFLSGTVTDQRTGETLAGVEVHLKGTNQVIYTDMEGRFMLQDLPEGEIVLEFVYPMYQVKTVPVIAAANVAANFGNEPLIVALEAR